MRIARGVAAAVPFGHPALVRTRWAWLAAETRAFDWSTLTVRILRTLATARPDELRAVLEASALGAIAAPGSSRRQAARLAIRAATLARAVEQVRVASLDSADDVADLIWFIETEIAAGCARLDLEAAAAWLALLQLIGEQERPDHVQPLDDADAPAPHERTDWTDPPPQLLALVGTVLTAAPPAERRVRAMHDA